MKIKAITTFAAVLLGSHAFAATCPDPSEFHYVNNRWVEPANWLFYSAPEGGETDQVDRLDFVDWESIVPGGTVGDIDWCQYKWKDQGLSDVVIFWIGNPMFATIDNMQYWTRLAPDSKAYRCTDSLQNCTFTFTDGR